jgi:hypothetical protein
LTGAYALPVFSIVITLSIIAPFFDIPSLLRKGKLQYYSLMLLAENEKDGLVIIHGGTLFDYWFVIDRNLNGRQRTNFIIIEFLEGLISMVSDYEEAGRKEIRIRGTTHIINERTAGKIGFRKVERDARQMIIFVYNYFNLLVSNSIARGRVALPSLRNVNTFESDIEALSDRKEYLIQLKNKISG